MTLTRSTGAIECYKEVEIEIIFYRTNSNSRQVLVFHHVWVLTSLLGFVMGKIMSSSSSMFIAMHNRMGTLDEINQILQVIHTSGEKIRSAYTNCREDTKIKN